MKFYIPFMIPIISFAIAGNFTSTNKIKTTNYHQMYVLGDSLFDSGDLVGAISQGIWKIKLDDPYYQNRSFCNGPVAPEILANKLNLSLTPGWKYELLFYDHQQVGNNYAIGGALASEDDAEPFFNFAYLQGKRFSINHQTDALISQHHDLQKNDLVILEAGNNDIVPEIYDSASKRDSAINNSISAEVATVKRLISQNVGHIIVTNLIDYSRIPEFVSGKLTQLAHDTSVTYDNKWDTAITDLQKQYPNVIKKYDLFQSFNRNAEAFKKRGVNITKSAIKSDWYKLLQFWNSRVGTEYINGATAETINNYLFLDNIHPTMKVQEIIAQEMYDLVTNW